MTNHFSDQEQIRFFSTASRLANRERISAVEESWLRGILERLAPAQSAEPGFPEQAVGDAGAPNNLQRTNWFNGRYLTAEALSRQDVYFDHRARLNAHALMPGIAWGLGIEDSSGKLNRLQGRDLQRGFPKSSNLTLKRGLAFDGVGRPILVSQDFRFTLEQLIGVSVKAPRRVVGGRREFMPCVCLAPEPGGPSGGSAALPTGPYLLVIEAGELPEGKAKVTGDVCGGRRQEPCAADAWRGSFGLSLVRFPVDVPLLGEIPDVWALRGTLSAYYFDVFEHPLWNRWDPEFPLDGSFSRGSEPGRHEGMAIPLALVHLGEDGTALYLDSWIPRRLITATPGEDWHRSRFGAPPRAAAWARIHQFQTMLQESQKLQPMAGADKQPRNLYDRGFRHIPPIGFLPVTAQSVFSTAALMSRSGMAEEALRQAWAYFEGTNVVSYGVVALHDDDILEDLSHVIDKDPLQLERAVNLPSNMNGDLWRTALSGSNGNPFTLLAWLAWLNLQLASQRGLEIDPLVNRSVEVVKLVVPLQGLQRLHPLLGVRPEDAGGQGQAWGLNPPPATRAMAMVGINPKADITSVPRGFVVYVKQRLVLLDLVFRVLERLQVVVRLGHNGMLLLGLSNRSTEAGLNQVRVSNFRAAFAAQSESDQLMLRSSLAQPVFQEFLRRALEAGAPAIARGIRPRLFLNEIQTTVQQKRLPLNQAVDQVADGWATEFSEAQILQLLAALQTPEQMQDLMRSLAASPGPNSPATVADGLDLKPPIFDSSASREVYTAVRPQLEERSLTTLVKSLPNSEQLKTVTVGEVLARTPQEAAALLGGEDKVKLVSDAFLRERKAALEAAQGLAAGVPAAVTTSLESAAAAGTPPFEALNRLKKEEESKPQPQRNAELLRQIDHAETLLRVSGNRLEGLSGLRRQPGG